MVVYMEYMALSLKEVAGRIVLHCDRSKHNLTEVLVHLSKSNSNNPLNYGISL